ncbi:MAG: 2-C-methyl-D-erythritol 2,4-cyclodiphosphate synthase [Clostridia bacterium]|nr:2-C-methyl-D-erythritol 2,4-cyclodiphosphate synthase [Clostridia bacterium]
MWYAVILGGGSGSRMGTGRNKVLMPLTGIPIIIRSLLAFEPFVDGMVLVMRKEDLEEAEQLLREFHLTEVHLVTGGQTRQDSVYHGLSALPADCDYVMIHDGARCLVDGATIRNVMDGVVRFGAAVASVPLTDTVKLADASMQVVDTPPRDHLHAVQTPQGFRTKDLLQAHGYARAHSLLGTDDASLLEAMGQSVTLTQGNTRNIKITRPEDMIVAEAYLSSLSSLRIGHGYDVHQLVQGRKLILCGVEIPHKLGLLGHSDADVAVHALMDAMLGACALGDIGHLFPDSDDAFLNISSLLLLEKVRDVISDKGYKLVNCDLTIVAQRPKLAAYIPQMRKTLAATLETDVENISIKATTTEHLGFEGRMEGISATAVVLLGRH